MDQQSMVEMPLNGRSPASLLSLLPGVSNVSDTGDLPTSRRIWVNIAGGRIEANTCTLDGSQWINIQYSYCNPLPPPDMLEEFSVETNSYDASKGLTSAATISAVTKSGTNQFTARDGIFSAIMFSMPKITSAQRALSLFRISLGLR